MSCRVCGSPNHSHLYCYGTPEQRIRDATNRTDYSRILYELEKEKNAQLEEALKQIAGDRCSNFTTGPGSCWSKPNLTFDAQYTADRWCVNCIARAALLPRHHTIETT